MRSPRRSRVLLAALSFSLLGRCASGGSSARPPPALPESQPAVEGTPAEAAPAGGGARPTPAPAAEGSKDGLSQETAALAHELSEAMNGADHELRVSVVPFVDQSGRPCPLGRYVSDKVVAGLGKSQHYVLVERARMDDVMKELKLSSSSLVSDETVATLGNMLGADALVLGTFTDLGESIDLDCRIVEPETGLIIGTAQARFRRTTAVAKLWGDPAPAAKPQTGAAVLPVATDSSARSQSAPPPAGRPLARAAWAAIGSLEAVAMENNVNRPGEDYKNFELGGRKPRLCQRACAEDPKCKAFTYVRPGIQGPKARCWLKSEVPKPTALPGAISGVKTDALAEVLNPVLTNREQRNFPNPQVDGFGLAYCMGKKHGCGIVTANAWCLRSGYTKALHYTAAADVGKSVKIKRLGDGGTCDHAGCDRISSIICVR